MKRKVLAVFVLGIFFMALFAVPGVVAQTSVPSTGTISINMPTAPGLAEGWAAVAKAYQEKHPGIKVVVDLKPLEGYDQWIKAQFSSSNPTADLVSVNLAGADAVGKRINWLEYTDQTSPYSNGPWKEQFNFQAQITEAAGDMAMLSFESVQVLWVYNKALFAKAGVTPPKTWKELVAVCEKLQKSGIQPLSVPGDFNSFYAMQMGWLAQIYADQTTRSIANVVRSKAGDYNYDPQVDGKWKYDPKDPWNDESWKININNVRMINAIKDGTYKPDSTGMKTVWSNLKQVFPKYAGGDAFFGTKDPLPLFYQGKAAILIDGAWRLPMFKTDMDKLTKGESIVSGEAKIDGVQKFDIGTFNMPSMEGPGIEAKVRTIEVALGFIGAPKKTKAHDDLVADFLMFYSSKVGASAFIGAALNAGWSPAGPSLVKGVTLPAEYGEMFKNLSFIGNAQKGWNASMARGAPSDIQESLRSWYGYSQEFLTGKITVDAWGTKHKTNILKYLPESMKAMKITDGDLKTPQNAPSGQ